MIQKIRGEQDVLAMRYTVIARIADGIPIPELAKRYEVTPHWLSTRAEEWGALRKSARPTRRNTTHPRHPDP